MRAGAGLSPARTSLTQGPLAPVVESPAPVYIGGIFIGAGCGAAILLLLGTLVA